MELSILIERDLDLVDLYYAHEVRAFHEESMPAKTIESLEAGECHTTCDWKMKFMAFQYREKQEKFFGKRGIPWHGAMMIWKGENGGYLVEFEDAVLQGGNEDATVSFGTLVQQWANFRSRHPGIHSTHLRTDGAACYAGAEFARLLPTAYEACGMRVLSHSIGEGGRNKTALDGHFGVSGAKARRSIVTPRGKLDAVSSAFLAAAHGASQIKGTHVQHVAVPGADAPAAAGPPGLGHMSSRVYEWRKASGDSNVGGSPPLPPSSSSPPTNWVCTSVKLRRQRRRRVRARSGSRLDAA